MTIEFYLIAAAFVAVALLFISAARGSSKLTAAPELAPLKTLEDRAQAVSDWVPARIRAKVAYKKILETEAWMLKNENESNVPFDKTSFVFEGVRYSPQIDFK